jgi:hypothetical protein
LLGLFPLASPDSAQSYAPKINRSLENPCIRRQADENLYQLAPPATHFASVGHANGAKAANRRRRRPIAEAVAETGIEQYFGDLPLRCTSRT